MKKMLTLFSVLALTSAFAFGGCKKNEEAPPADTTKPAEATPPVTPPAEKPAEAPPAEKPAEPAAGEAAAATGIPECDAYAATMAKYAACDKLPADAKKAMTDAFEQSKQGWAQLAQAPAEAKTAAGTSCKTADDAAKTALTSLGCN
jgi:hypothetical protein